MNGESEHVEGLLRDREQLEKQVEEMDKELDAIKGDCALMTTCLNTVRWQIEMLNKQLTARQEGRR